jgi:2-dehydropantoate 2-reductase
MKAEKRFERICVAGVGSIGSLFAGHLSQVASVSALTRREDHAEALRRDGLRISGRSEVHGALRASVDPNDLPVPDLVIVACKGNEVAQIGARMCGSWPEAIVMTVQNGIGADEIVAGFGNWSLLNAVTFMSGTRHSDTHVEYVLDTETWIGPSRDTTGKDAERVAGLIRDAGLKADAFDDLRPVQWSKLIFNATVNSVAALTGLPHDHHFAAIGSGGDLGLLVRDLIDEGKRVAQALGLELEEDPWEMNVLATRRGSAHYPSMLEDVEARRATEIDLITGSLIREARRRAVPVPLHEAIYRLIKAKEESWR